MSILSHGPAHVYKHAGDPAASQNLSPVLPGSPTFLYL